MTQQYVLITGGAGYIGSHCVLVLLQSGYDVLVLDNCSNTYSADEGDKPESLKRVEKLTGKTLSYVYGDFSDCQKLKNVFTRYKISCVIHCAALKSVKQSCDLPLPYYTNNVAGSLNLLQAMSECGVKSIIFSSSSSVYGNPQFLPVTEDHPTGENCANPYGRTKFMVEEILKDISLSDKEWKVYSLRYFNPVGAHPSGEIGEDPLGIPSNLMPVVSQVAVGKLKELAVYGDDYNTPDGTCVRDYIHIMDLAEGHIAAVGKLLTEKKGGIFKAYNLGTGSGVSVLQVVNTFEKVNKINIPCKVAPGRAGDIASSYCAVDLAKKELVWEAKYGLVEMCRDSWNWQSKNPKGYRK
ncbi:UDP-glucose 4-epimerase-like [Planococcus citri]|uniref:UDP-glucose 4-epimerase-like n=1 Tax=Planococcus citri TaxID=170843 RepID=UPI0031F8E1AD